MSHSFLIFFRFFFCLSAYARFFRSNDSLFLKSICVLLRVMCGVWCVWCGCGVVWGVYSSKPHCKTSKIAFLKLKICSHNCCVWKSHVTSCKLWQISTAHCWKIRQKGKNNQSFLPFCEENKQGEGSRDFFLRVVLPPALCSFLFSPLFLLSSPHFLLSSLSFPPLSLPTFRINEVEAAMHALQSDLEETKEKLTEEEEITADLKIDQQNLHEQMVTIIVYSLFVITG